MSDRNIPSEEDFERARAAMREKHRGLSEVCSRIMKRFQNDGVREVFIFYSPADNSFGTYIFFRRSEQVGEADRSGLAEQIKEAVIEGLESVGRGNRDTLKVDFEFDSHENVVANFEGDYFLRLR